MSETTDTTTTDAQAAGGPGEPGVELSDEDLQTLAAATAGAEFTDSFRPPTRPGTDASGSDDESAEATDEDPDDEGEGDEENPNREAAKWRTKLRDAEAQRDAVAAQLEAMQRATIDTQVEALGIKPAALWASGADLADLLDENGVPDTAKVKAAASSAREALGIPGPTRPSRGMHSGASAPQRTRNGFVDAFRPRSRDE